MSSLYILVEGEKTKPALFRAWLPLLIPKFGALTIPEDSERQNGFYLLAGYGYPSLLT